jgi:hypothetical protein
MDRTVDKSIVHDGSDVATIGAIDPVALDAPDDLA